MKFRKLTLIAAATFPALSIAGIVNQTSGKITTLRTSSSYHESIQSSQDIETIFQLSSDYTSCQWVGIKNSDTVFVSTVLSAQAQSKEITVWYYSDKFSPTWSSVCQAITVEVK